MSMIKLLRTYTELGKYANYYSLKTIKEMLSTGLFKLIVPGRQYGEKIVSSPDELKDIELGRISEGKIHLSLENIKPVITEKNGKLYVKLGDEEAELLSTDALWITRTPLDSRERNLIAKWLAKIYGFTVSDNATIKHNDTYVEIIDADTRYRVSPHLDEVEVLKEIKIGPAIFSLSSVLGKEDIGKEVAEKIVPVFEKHKDTIDITQKTHKITVLSEEVSVDVKFTVKQTEFILSVTYCPYHKTYSVLLCTYTDSDYNIIHRMMKDKYKELLPEEDERDIVLRIRNTNIEQVTRLLDEALGMLEQAKEIVADPLRPEEVVDEIGEALKRGRIPVLDRLIPPEIYIYGVLYGSKEVKEHLTKYYSDRVIDSLLQMDEKEYERTKRRIQRMGEQAYALLNEINRELEEIVNEQEALAYEIF